MAKKGKGPNTGRIGKKVVTVDERILGDIFKTSVFVIGAGGTGSHVVMGLAAMHVSLVQLGHPGLMVKVFDSDKVEPHNVGRQHHGWGAQGRNKASEIVSRANRMYGTQFTSSRWNYHEKTPLANIMITCVDQGAIRNTLNKVWRKAINEGDAEQFTEHGGTKVPVYWLDLGNDTNYGQVCLASRDLPTPIELWGEFSEEMQTETCSTEDSLEKQDLFINQTIATIGLNLMWNLFRRTKVEYHAVFLNLEKNTMKPMLTANLN